MQNKNFIIITLIIGLCFLIGGYFLGTTVEKQKTTPLLREIQTLRDTEKNIEQIEEIVKSMSSPVIFSITAFGEVTNIKNGEIILRHEDKNLSVKVREDAQVISHEVNVDEEGNIISSERIEVGMSEIKIGDLLNISLKVSSDGTIEGDSIVIIIPF